MPPQTTLIKQAHRIQIGEKVITANVVLLKRKVKSNKLLVNKNELVHINERQKPN